MKKISCLFCLLAIVTAAKAQIVSLNKNEVVKMRAGIKNEKHYQDVFKNFEQAAQQALEATPNPIAEIQSQGLLAGDPRKTASLKAVEDADKTYALAFTYKVSGD